MVGKSLVSIDDYSKDEYLEILELAAKYEKKPRQGILQGYVIATLFLNLPPEPGSALNRP
jgi:aspartate carbamoyltransferase catalytic subunit